MLSLKVRPGDLVEGFESRLQDVLSGTSLLVIVLKLDDGTLKYLSVKSVNEHIRNRLCELGWFGKLLQTISHLFVLLGLEAKYLGSVSHESGVRHYVIAHLKYVPSIMGVSVLSLADQGGKLCLGRGENGCFSDELDRVRGHLFGF